MTHDERQAIEIACERLIRQFALLNDAHDHAALAALFTEAGSFARPTNPDEPIEGRAAIHTFFRDRPARTTRHLMSNIVVDVTSATQAYAHSYVLLITGERGEKMLVGDFHDVFAFDEGVWKFASRRGSLAFAQ